MPAVGPRRRSAYTYVVGQKSARTGRPRRRRHAIKARADLPCLSLLHSRQAKIMLAALLSPSCDTGVIISVDPGDDLRGVLVIVPAGVSRHTGLTGAAPRPGRKLVVVF